MWDWWRRRRDARLQRQLRCLSVDHLVALSEKAVAADWSGVGRNEWLLTRRDSVSLVLLRVHGHDGRHRGLYRCLVYVRTGADWRCFTLDVTRADLRHLDLVAASSVEVELARRVRPEPLPVLLDET